MYGIELTDKKQAVILQTLSTETLINIIDA